jgi:hypothetical protein
VAPPPHTHLLWAPKTASLRPLAIFLRRHPNRPSILRRPASSALPFSGPALLKRNPPGSSLWLSLFPNPPPPPTTTPSSRQRKEHSTWQAACLSLRTATPSLSHTHTLSPSRHTHSAISPCVSHQGHPSLRQRLHTHTRTHYTHTHTGPPLTDASGLSPFREQCVVSLRRPPAPSHRILYRRC